MIKDLDIRIRKKDIKITIINMFKETEYRIEKNA